jgi:hypothetical protein
MRRQSETLKMLGIIDAGMHREFNEDRTFCQATFELSDGIYHVDSNFNIREEDTSARGSSYLPLHFCKGGIYPEVYISGMPIKLYVLTMIATDDSAFEKYQSGLEINHTVISKVSPKKLNIGHNNFYDKEVIITTAPREELSYNPAYLEFVTRGENVRHGKFIKDFALYDTYVSAHDVDTLRGILIPYDPSLSDRQDDWVRWNRSKVEQFYKNKGVDKQVLF